MPVRPLVRYRWRKYFYVKIGRSKWCVFLKPQCEWPKNIPKYDPEEILVGICWHKKKTIYIVPGVDQNTTLDHEIIHAKLPHLSERQVRSLESALFEGRRALMRAGTP